MNLNSDILSNLTSLKSISSRLGNTCGIDIGSFSLKVCEVKKAKSGLALESYILKHMPPELRIDPKKANDFVVSILQEAVKEKKITAEKAFVSLGGKEVKLLSITIPRISKKDLKSAVIMETRKQLAFNDADSEIGFQITSEFADRIGAKLNILVAIADKKAIQDKVSLVEKAGLRPGGIGIVPNALASVVTKAGVLSPEEVTMVIDMGASGSSLVIFRNGKLEFAREIATGGDHITQSLVRKITLPDREVNITLEMAEGFKRQCGIPGKEELSEKVDFLNKSHILAMMRPVLERLSTEVTRSANFYRQRFKVQKIDRLVLTGGCSHLRNIEKFFKAKMGDIDVEVLDPLSVVSEYQDTGVTEDILIEDISPYFSISLGLACGISKNEIDFLPLEIRLQEKFNILNFVLKATVPVILLVIFFFYIILNTQVRHYRALLNEAKTTIRSFEPTRLLISEYDALNKKMQERKTLLEKAVGRQPIWWGVLKELGDITPKGVSLERLSVVKRERPFKLRLEGVIVPSYVSIDLALSQYLLALDESPFFEKVELVSQTRDVYSPTPRAKFEITLRIVY